MRLPAFALYSLVLSAFTSCWAAGAPALAAVLEVGPADAPGIRSVYGLQAAELGPGTVIRLHAGEFVARIVIPVSGTDGNPIVVEGRGDGVVRLDHAIVLHGASFVVLRRLRLEGAGIELRQGSHDVTVQDNDIANARLGVWIGDGAGDHNLIEGNTIRHSDTQGIAVDGVNAAPGRETVIARNRVFDSGVHGIELSGNYYRVENNYVSGNGRTSTGTSGIHIYAPDAQAGVGRHNVLRGNIAVGTRDASAQDGNGIQLDQWCDDNIVIGNIASGNDGAGISVFDAAHARIIRNTLYGNMRDPGNSHRHKGELVFATDDEHDVDGTRDAVADGNIVVATNPNAAAILVDKPTALHPPLFSANLLDHEGKGPLARWAGGDVAGLDAWDRVAPHRTPDMAGHPRFLDTATPQTGGLALAPGQNAAWRELGWK